MNTFFTVCLWIDLIFSAGSASEFWDYLNNHRQNDNLRRLMNGESFYNPTFQDMLNCWALEGCKEEPTIQAYLKYRQSAKEIYISFNKSNTQRVTL